MTFSDPQLLGSVADTIERLAGERPCLHFRVTISAFGEAQLDWKATAGGHTGQDRTIDGALSSLLDGLSKARCIPVPTC